MGEGAKASVAFEQGSKQHWEPLQKTRPRHIFDAGARHSHYEKRIFIDILLPLVSCVGLLLLRVQLLWHQAIAPRPS